MSDDEIIESPYNEGLNVRQCERGFFENIGEVLDVFHCNGEVEFREFRHALEGLKKLMMEVVERMRKDFLNR